MSKPNTQHIIGFAVKQYNVALPAVVDLFLLEGYYEDGYIIEDYFE